jgi:hypothetical protein
MAAGPGSANEKEGFAGVGTPPGPMVGGDFTWTGLRWWRDLEPAGPELGP